MTEPPTALSDLLDLAIRDARSLDRTVYTPHWRDWHRTRTECDPLTGMPIPKTRRCNICLAGGMIAGTLKAAPTAHVSMDAAASEQPLTARWEAALIAVEYARAGEWGQALLRLGKAPTNAAAGGEARHHTQGRGRGLRRLGGVRSAPREHEHDGDRAPRGRVLGARSGIGGRAAGRERSGEIQQRPAVDHRAVRGRVREVQEEGADVSGHEEVSKSRRLSALRPVVPSCPGLEEPTKMTMVESRRIHRLQGWRYLKPADAPPDRGNEPEVEPLG